MSNGELKNLKNQFNESSRIAEKATSFNDNRARVLEDYKLNEAIDKVYRRSIEPESDYDNCLLMYKEFNQLEIDMINNDMETEDTRLYLEVQEMEKELQRQEKKFYEDMF